MGKNQLCATDVTTKDTCEYFNLTGFGGIPAGTYLYVDKDTASCQPEDMVGTVQFDFFRHVLTWKAGANGGEGQVELVGEELEFFQGIYLSDLPVTDWLKGTLKDVEGYAGMVAEGVQITFDENGLIQAIETINPQTRVTAILSDKITAPKLTVKGSTRGVPRLLHSCVTILGSMNALYFTGQGDFILDHVAIGNDGNGVGLTSDKTGGDVFVVGHVTVDGEVNWCSVAGVILPLASKPGILETNGYDIIMTGGSNIGRVGRDLTISSGKEKGGNIILGAKVTTDSTRGGITPHADTSVDGVTINTSGQIIAGKGDVVIGTNKEKAVTIDIIGGIQGNNVTLQPVFYGQASDVTGSIGDISADGDITIVVGNVNKESNQLTSVQLNGFDTWKGSKDSNSVAVGNLVSSNGNIFVTMGEVNGYLGEFTALNGKVVKNIACQRID